jgi:cytoskeleton protein RodZ
VPSFGEKLRKEREQRKITLDDISSTSKISTRMLRALEEEHFDQLPGGIFNKGFVRAYARHVGLDEEQTVSDYLAAAEQTSPPVTDPEPGVSVLAAQAAQQERLRSLNTNRTAPIPWGVLAAIVLLGAVALLFWSRYRRADHGKNPAPVSENAPQSSPSAAAEPPSDAALPVSESPSHRSTVAASSEFGADARSSGGISSPASAVEKITGHADQSTLSTNPAMSPGGVPHALTLVIKATEDSWISINVDGITAKEELLIAGAQKSIPANREIKVRAGNVGGLVFLLNGKQFPPQGEFGEVKTLLFDSNGVVRPLPH